MMRLMRRGGRHEAAWITSSYILVALLSDVASDPLGRLLSAEGVSPISSASATAILSAMASGMMALTAIMFSLVFVALQLTNAAYSPRLLGVIGDDHFLAHALGIFTGTFVFALMAIRSIDMSGVPGIALARVIVAFAWLFASVIVLVCLLPRIRGLSMGEVLRDLHRRACAAATRLYPVGIAGSGERQTPALEPVSHVIRHSGDPAYVIGLDLERLVACAAAADAQLVIPAAIGDELIDGDPLALVHGGTRSLDEHVVRHAVWVARDRTTDSDPAYAIRLLVDIAIRALSPAVNDPTTAVNVLGELDSILRFVGRRRLDDNHARDARGVLRVVHAVSRWDDLVALALTEIRQYGHDSWQVQRRLSAMLRDLPGHLPSERAAVLERFASGSRCSSSFAPGSPMPARAGAPR